MRQLLLLLVGAGLLGAAPAARAQGVFNMGSLTNTLAIPTGPAKAASPAARPAASLRYTVTAGLEQQTVQRYVARNKAANPTAAQAIGATFGPGKTSYGQLYRDILTDSGFSDYDVASALGLYLELGYRIVHNIQDDKVITPTQERALRTQVAQLASQNPEVNTPAGAARLGEELKLQTVVLAMGWAQARQSGTQASSFQAEVARQFKLQYNLDFQQLKLTNQGFVRK